jgi:hypothetical protein
MTTSTNSAVITVGYVKDLIDNEIIEFIAHPDYYSLEDYEFNAIVLGVSNYLGLRDYVMGLPVVHDIKLVREWISFFITELSDNDDDLVPFHTIYSALSYELEELTLANAYLSLGIQKDYPLATLLSRVYSAGWPIESVARMRQELHPKVIQSLLERESEGILI